MCARGKRDLLDPWGVGSVVYTRIQAVQNLTASLLAYLEVWTVHPQS